MEAADLSRPLRRLVLAGGLWEVFGFAAIQGLRLGNNLVLSRLLDPSAFGLMALVGTVMSAVEILSDIGIGPTVLQSRRGGERSFLNTVWTVQTIRGAALALVVLLLAPLCAVVYRQPQLGPLIAASGVGALVAGFSSTSIYSLRRRLALGKVVAIETASYATGILATLLWALCAPTVWAFVGGNLVGMTTRVLLSHTLSPDPPNRFAWQAESLRELRRFGKWIFLGAGVFFLGKQADRLLVGRFVSPELLGLYSIAFVLHDLVPSLVARVSHGVLLPALARVARETPARLREVYYGARRATDAVALPAVGVLMTAGSEVVDLLLDHRYAPAGSFLEILCVRAATDVVAGQCETTFLARGRARPSFLRNLSRALWVLVGTPLAWRAAGFRGVLWVAALAEVPGLLILWGASLRESMLDIPRELRALSFLGAGMVLGTAVSSVLLSLH